MTKRAIDRRQLLRTTIVAGLLAPPSASAFDAIASRRAAVAAEPPAVLSTGLRRFFTASERAFILAAVERLIPADDEWPGAAGLGVGDFIEDQLTGAYGEATSWYMQGPWRDGTPAQGFQSRHSPAALFRAGIEATDAHCRQQFGDVFAGLTTERQDEVLHGLEGGDIALDGVHAATFFSELHQITVEGFFGDPVYGGNRDMRAWRMIGFPGARYDYRAHVDRHNVRLEFEPVSVAGPSAR